MGQTSYQTLAGLIMRVIGYWLFSLFIYGYMQPLFADQPREPATVWQQQDFFLLAQNAQQNNAPGNNEISPPPASGTLVLPGAGDNTETSEKKCMTVCAQWGEECSYINRGSAGTTRSCRRTCQQYKEECF